MGDLEHTPLAEGERKALRRYADGLDEDWAIGVLIGSAVWNVERLEAQLAGAEEALEKIEARADPKRKLDGTAAAVALDSIYRWARKGLDRPRGQ